MSATAQGTLARRDPVRAARSNTAVADGDGPIVVHFGACKDGRRNCIPIIDGWNYTVRLYRPRAEILDGNGAFPTIEPLA